MSRTTTMLSLVMVLGASACTPLMNAADLATRYADLGSATAEPAQTVSPSALQNLALATRSAQPAPAPAAQPAAPMAVPVTATRPPVSATPPPTARPPDPRFSVQWSGWGSGSRALEDAVARQVAGDPRVSWDGARPDLALQNVSVRTQCMNTVQTTTASHNYLASTAPVPNPDYGRALHERDEAAQREREAERDVARAQEAERTAERAESAIRNDEWARAHDALTRAQRALADAQARLQSARRLADASARVDKPGRGPVNGHPGRAGRGPVPGTNASPQAQAQAIQRLTAEVRADQRSVAAAQAAMDTANADLQSARQRADAAEQRLERARETLAYAQRRVEVASARVAQTPQWLQHDVWQTVNYPVDTVTRTCRAVATVTVQTPTGRGMRTFSASASTTDQAHAGYPGTGVTIDPLQFDRSDSQLIAQAIGRLARPITAMVTSARDDYFANNWGSYTGA